MPDSYKEWIRVAEHRGKDAVSMLPDRSSSSGPAYMAGYTIECMLKAYLQRIGKPTPTSGREGHNLKALWSAANLRLSDLGDRKGHKAFFVRQWSTDMRYEMSSPKGHTSEELVQAAKQVAGYIKTLMRRL